MRFSLSWLREYVRLPESPEEVARALTEHAFETSVEQRASPLTLDKIVVGEILSAEKHPNADRLLVATVRVKGKTLTIVCGAKRLHPGMRVAVALPGATVIANDETPQVLERATIRGVRSEGMICQDWELRLGDDHTDVMQFPPEVKSGTPLRTLFPPDALLTTDILPDRAPDASSHVGVARELGAILGRPVRLPRHELPRAISAKLPFRVTIDDPALCTRFLVVLIENLRAGPSPMWMQARLRAMGMRPHTLIVDVTNYVMWEIGQPTHAFDADAIRSSLGVRSSRGGKTREHIVTLDGVRRDIPEGTLVLTSDDAPIDIAGMMGGEDSSVRDDTTSIVLTSALFDHDRIRTAVQNVGLRTEASDRFSHGVTGHTVAAGAARVAELLVKLGGGKVTAVRDVYPKPPKSRPIQVFLSTVRGILGMPVQGALARTILKRLGYSIAGTAQALRVTPSPFRADVEIPEDVIEDIGRIVGYDRLPAPLPSAPLTPAALPLELRDTRRLQDALKGAGWAETYTYSFMQEEEALALQLHKVENLQIVNPISRDNVRLRTSLLPNLLHLAWSAVKKEPVFRVFEVGKIYPVNKPERTQVAGFLIRRGREAHGADFYEVKGIVEHVLHELGIPDVWFDPTEPTPEDVFLFVWERGKSAEVQSGNEKLGFVGAISADVLNRFRIQGTIVAFELNLSRILELERGTLVYNPPLPYPTIQRDLSLRVPEQVLVDEIMEAIAGAGGPLVQDVDFVDLYDDPSGMQKGVTVRITYGSRDRTLRDDEVNTLHRQIVAKITDDLGVEERG